MNFSEEQMRELNYLPMDSPVKGRIYSKRNGTVIFVEQTNQLELPNGNKIQNPTYQDLAKDYTEFIGFKPSITCTPCSKK